MSIFKRSWKKVATLALISVLVLVFTAGCSNSEGTETTESKGEVTIGYVNWAECVAVSNLWKVILEDQGYEVELTQLDVAPLYAGLSTGDVDIFLDAWLPGTHGNYLDEYGDDYTDLGSWYEGEAKLGLAVPTYVTIDSIEELNDEIEKFDGKITGIEPGAGMMQTTRDLIDSYGLDYELLESSEAAMLTSLESAYENEEWIVCTVWSPHWMFASWDLKYLEDPQLMFGASEEIRMLGNAEFCDENVEIVEMLGKFKMDDSQIGGLEGLINDGMEEVEAATQWISENQEIVDGWLN